MSFYVSLFDDGEVLDITRWQKGEPDDYGFSKRFAWVADRVGVVW